MTNPYHSPDTATDAGRPVTSDGDKRASPTITCGLMVLGSAATATLFSFGYAAIVFYLEEFFVPPLKSPPTYGQFGFALIAQGAVGVLIGAAFGLIPHIRYVGWLSTCVLAILAITTVAMFLRGAEVLVVAMPISLGLVALLVAIVDTLVRQFSYLRKSNPPNDRTSR